MRVMIPPHNRSVVDGRLVSSFTFEDAEEWDREIRRYYVTTGQVEIVYVDHYLHSTVVAVSDSTGEVSLREEVIGSP